MKVAKYIINICQDEQIQTDIIIKHKNFLNNDIYKDDCGCTFYLVEQENLEPLRVYLNICIFHLFQNKLAVEETQIRHKSCLFKPLVWIE